MPNYRYRPNYKKPKDNNWIVIFILFMIFGGGSAIAGIISGLFPLLIIGFVIYGIMNSKNGGNSFKKYSSSFENSTFRSYRNNSYRPIYNTFNGVNNDYENINKKLALRFFNEEKVSRLNKPYLQGEDFGSYCQAYDSCFFMLGCGFNTQLHTNTFNFDEEILITGSDFFKKITKMEF